MSLRCCRLFVSIFLFLGAFSACGPKCPKGQILCRAICVNVESNQNHCGACEARCAVGDICQGGKCELSCPSAQVACDGVCADLQTNAIHCGVCGNTCAKGKACQKGKCTPNCPKEQSNCNDLCVSTATDNVNCGACGNVCNPGESCKGGKCALTCSLGYEKCGGVCANLKQDRTHCGTCKNACADGQICTDGKCGFVCSSQSTLCSDLCVDIKTSFKNCGQCHHSCQTGEVCDSGICRRISCPGGSNLCKGTCVDFKSNSNHCGKCDYACPSGQTCSMSKCVLSCAAGEILCGGKCTNVLSDVSHCGACGTTCQAEETCHSGKCETCSDCPSWAISVGSFLGTTQFHDVATDASGNIYAVGHFSSILRIGSSILNSGFTGDILIVKLSPLGKVIWARKAGDFTAEDVAYSIVIGSDSSVYVTGVFQKNGAFGSFSFKSAGLKDIFIAKLDKDGKWLWVKSYGSTYDDYAYSIAVDSKGASVITGYFQGNITFGAFSFKSKGGLEIFILKLDSTGKEVWAKGVGSTLEDKGLGVAIDNKDNIYIQAAFSSTISLDTKTLSSRGKTDVFVAKFDPSGKILYLSGLGGTSDDTPLGLAVDSLGNAYITGYYSSSSLQLGSLSVHSNKGLVDAYVAKLGSTGQWDWVVVGGGPQDDFGRDIQVNRKGDVFVGGYFLGEVTFGQHTKIVATGKYDSFLIHISNKGVIQGFVEGKGLSDVYIRSLAIDSQDNLFVAGDFLGTAHFGPKKSLSTRSKPSAFVVKYLPPANTYCPSTKNYTVCNGICSDTEIDSLNCGQCKLSCKTGEKCTAGKCGAP